MNTGNYIEELIAFRRELHRYPEVSDEESETAARIKSYLQRLDPDRIVDGIGGHGIIAEFRGREKGPTVMFRCELDALPIPEKNDLPYASVHAGKGHLCGHDGHMSILLGLGHFLKDQRPSEGRVLLLFQPSEENGKGAERMIKDSAFREFEPDYIFAIHNLPGYPLHQVVLARGTFAAASSGMRIELTGKSSHAAEPEKGINPAFGMARMINAFQDVLTVRNLFREFTLLTPIHVRLGSIAYGTSPGEGVIHLTLRSYLDSDMAMLKNELKGLIMTIAKDENLECNIDYEEVFPATANDERCTQIAESAARQEDFDAEHLKSPFKWSEDFGHFTGAYRGALFGLGSGSDQPALHNPDYDFPDELIPTGVTMYTNICRQILSF
jgi:amidohydrolase